MSKKIYKGLEIMQMISKGQIANRTRFDFENNNFVGVVEYDNGILYWIIFDERWNEKGKKNLFEMFNIQSTMVADFEPLIEDQVDIDNIEEMMLDGVEDVTYFVNDLIKAVKQLNKEIKSIKEK